MAFWDKDKIEIDRETAEEYLERALMNNRHLIVEDSSTTLNDVLSYLDIEEEDEPIIGRWLTTGQYEVLFHGISDMSDQSLIALLNKIENGDYVMKWS